MLSEVSLRKRYTRRNIPEAQKKALTYWAQWITLGHALSRDYLPTCPFRHCFAGAEICNRANVQAKRQFWRSKHHTGLAVAYQIAILTHTGRLLQSALWARVKCRKRRLREPNPNRPGLTLRNWFYWNCIYGKWKTLLAARKAAAGVTLDKTRTDAAHQCKRLP